MSNLQTYYNFKLDFQKVDHDMSSFLQKLGQYSKTVVLLN